MIIKLLKKPSSWLLIVSIILPNSIHFDCSTAPRGPSLLFKENQVGDLGYREASDQPRLSTQRTTVPTQTRDLRELPAANINNKYYQHPINHNNVPRMTIGDDQQAGWWLSRESQTNRGLREPVNIPPTMINQEQATQLARYMKNYANDDGNPNQKPLNLASINNRAVPLNQPGANVVTTRADSATSSRLPNSHLTDSYGERLQKNDYQERSDQLVTGSRYEDQLVPKNARSEEVIFKSGRHQQPSHNPNFHPPISPAKKLISQTMAGHKTLILEKFDQNCITKSAPITSRCEDHLIKRLSQDSTEGRTVVDVGRRVCCALFWHQDCISRIVLDTCPDSSPAAADFLMGSRKLDLSLSCQKFNRDGCNSTTRLMVSVHSLLLNIVIVMLVFNRLLFP